MSLWRKLLLSIFPRPRRTVRWQDALALVVFLALFAAVAIGLEQADVLLFSRPAMLLLVLLAPWVWWMHFAGYGGLPRIRGQVALWARFLLLGLFAFALAEPRAVRSRDVLSVMYVVDVSDSITSASSDQAIQYVTASVNTKPGRDEAGLSIFGKGPAVELPPRASFPFEGVFNSRIDGGATNLEQALSLAAAMLPAENAGRLVLITDGVQTEGSLSRLMDDFRARNLPVDVLPIDYSYEKEVWLERLELPQQVKLGETYEAATLLSALTPGEGTLVVRENGQVVAEVPVTYQAGKNRISIPISLRSPGYYEYTATIETNPTNDSLAQNNTVLNYIFVEGEGRVLLVVDPFGEERDHQKLAEVLRSGERAVDVVNADTFPSDAASLMPYDCVVFVNVPNDQFDAVQLRALRDAVYDLGMGFLMVGGENSFGPGGYQRTVVEDILPVSMDVTQKKVLPKGALALILHTCEFPEGNTYAKRITKEAIKTLSEQDEAGVLAYTENGEEWVFDLTPVSQYETMVPKINGANIGDMPSFARTMELGLAGLKKNDASTKHMIIISDGDPQPPPPAMIQDYIDSKISISMVAIFPHGGEDISKMRAIATATGGRYYFPQDPNQLPQIFIKEAKTLRRSMLQQREFTPEIEFPSPILKGVEAMPELKGYVLTTAKDAPAMTVLRVPPDEKEPDQLDPLLVVWQHGLGKTAAWTSDFSANWASNWQNWDRLEAFTKQLVTDISRVRKEGSLRMSTYNTGGEATIVIEDFNPEESFLETQARITGPGDRSETVTLRQVSPRRYQATIPLWGHGRYHVSAQGKGGERTDQVFGGFIVPYSPEYLRLRSDRKTLDDIAERTEGRVLTGDPEKDAIYTTARRPQLSSRPIFDWFLIALAILLIIDVAVRRIQIDADALRSLLFWKRRQGPATATMGTLLQRKQEVSQGLQTRREERALPTAAQTPTPPRVSGATTPKPASKPSTPPAAPPKADGDKPMSTTERLLQMKKRREDDKPS